MQGFLRHSPEENALRKTLLMVYSFSIGCYILSGSFLLTMGFLKPETNKVHRIVYCLLGFSSIGLCTVGAIASKSTEKDALNLATNDYLRANDQKKDLVRRAYFDEAERNMRFEQAKQQMEMAVNGNFKQIYSALQSNIEQQQNQQKLIVNLAQQIQQLKQQNQTATATNSQSSNTPKAINPEVVDPKNKFIQQIDQLVWLKQLLKAKPLLVWGEQGSGKTTFVQFLALCRMVIFNHQVTVSDPHAHLNDWLKCFEILGSEFDYSEIDQALAAYYERLKANDQPTTSIWDELTKYEENCDPQLAGQFLKSILSDVRKVEEYPILISHGNTLSALAGGKGGVKNMQINGLVEIHLHAYRDDLGDLHPALKGTISGLAKDEQGKPISIPIKLEKWMQPEYILSTFPELKAVDRSSSSKNKPLSSTGQKIIQNMEKSPEDKIKSDFWGLINQLQSDILKKAESAGSEGITPSFVLNNCTASAKIKKRGDAESFLNRPFDKAFIEQMFVQLANEGKGRIEQCDYNGQIYLRFFTLDS